MTLAHTVWRAGLLAGSSLLVALLLDTSPILRLAVPFELPLGESSVTIVPFQLWLGLSAAMATLSFLAPFVRPMYTAYAAGVVAWALGDAARLPWWLLPLPLDPAPVTPPVVTMVLSGLALLLILALHLVDALLTYDRDGRRREIEPRILRLDAAGVVAVFVALGVVAVSLSIGFAFLIEDVVLTGELFDPGPARAFVAAGLILLVVVAGWLLIGSGGRGSKQPPAEAAEPF